MSTDAIQGKSVVAGQCADVRLLTSEDVVVGSLMRNPLCKKTVAAPLSGEPSGFFAADRDFEGQEYFMECVKEVLDEQAARRARWEAEEAKRRA